jgi:Sulfotransferase family
VGRDPSGRDKRSVLVTGMHRSGTSWLGHMLCAGKQFINVPEPLNVLNRQTILPSRVRHWYTYITDKNDHLYLRFYRDALAFRPHPIQDVKRMRFGSPRDPIRIPKRWASFLLGRVQNRRLLLRDPFAVFSIAWFLGRLDCEIVVIVRHPVAVVSSLKRLGFTFDFNDLLQQPLLMDERLERFRPDMEATLRTPDDVIGQGSLLWRMVYESVAADQMHTPRVRLVRHEDLSLNPIEGFSRLYESLGLPFDERTRRTIERATSDRNPTEVSQAKPFKVRLDSRENLANWRHRLDHEEVDRVLELTQDVAERYYQGLECP